MSRRKGTIRIKKQLFLNCGRVDMYNMEIYAKDKIQLHHDPPYRLTKNTIYEESYLLSEKTHKELHQLELNDMDEYNKRMEIIRNNKKILERKKE